MAARFNNVEYLLVRLREVEAERDQLTTQAGESAESMALVSRTVASMEDEIESLRAKVRVVEAERDWATETAREYMAGDAFKSLKADLDQTQSEARRLLEENKSLALKNAGWINEARRLREALRRRLEHLASCMYWVTDGPEGDYCSCGLARDRQALASPAPEGTP